MWNVEPNISNLNLNLGCLKMYEKSSLYLHFIVGNYVNLK